jgi:hypothetical protein
MIKRLLSLLWNGADSRQYFLEIGTYFLKLGVGYQLNEIIEQKPLANNKKGKVKVKFIANLTYDFRTNQVYHQTAYKIIDPTNKKAVE